MSFDIILSNLLNPPILFFALGMLAVWFGSDLDLPQPAPKLLSLYLLLAIGFRGGVELRHSGATLEVGLTLIAAIAMAVAVPLYTYWLLRRRFDAPNAAAIAATYGSISAVTFIAGASFLTTVGLPFSGHMVAAMALMESPAIVIGVVLARCGGVATDSGINWRALVREAFFNGSVFVLMGSLVIGAATGPAGHEALRPFTDDIFKGLLALFLLDMGLVSARRLSGMRRLGIFPLVFATAVPLVNAAAGIGLARVIGLSPGDALLFCILCASASYIAVPAAVRLAIPEANPGVYVTMALALTFPFNIVVGLPLYMMTIQAIWR